MPNVLQKPISKPDNVLAARSSFGLSLKLTDDFTLIVKLDFGLIELCWLIG